jgi:hypothetical protein
MKLTYTAANDRIVFECEVATEKGAFEQLAYLEELFEETACGCCQSPDIRPDVREVDGNKFYNLKCRACSARLDFGQTKKGEHLFAKRRGDDKKLLPHNGWYQYQPTVTEQPKGSRSQSPPPPANAIETTLAAITAANDAKTLQKVGEQIARDIAEGKIPRTEKPALTRVWAKRLKEITGKAQVMGPKFQSSITA